MQINLSDDLEKALFYAQHEEDADRHLPREERKAIVDLFRQENPQIVLPEDMDEAYVQIIDEV